MENRNHETDLAQKEHDAYPQRCRFCAGEFHGFTDEGFVRHWTDCILPCCAKTADGRYQIET